MTVTLSCGQSTPKLIMATDVCIRFSLIFALIKGSFAYVKCGDWVCYGTGAYCCNHNPESCCYYMWSFWWFWMVWLLLFTLLITCGFWCRRRYRYRREYILVRQPNSIAQAGPNGTVTVYGTVEGAAAYTATASMPTAPTKPPAYTDQKPPSYTRLVS